MPDLHLDIETYSSVSLADYGVYRYAEAPDFQVLMCSWALGDEPVRMSFGDDIKRIPGLWDPAVRKVAHNANFERVCLSRLGGLPPGEYLDPAYWHDTAAVAAATGWPRLLGHLAKALAVDPKDSAGPHLINWFCKPAPRTRERRLPKDHPEKWQQFVEYARQDTVTLRQVHQRLGELPTDTEREMWRVDQLINDRGMRVDLPLAHAAVAAAEDNKVAQELEFTQLTGVLNPNSNPQKLAWAKAEQMGMANLQEATVTEALASDRLSEPQRRALELHQELALVAHKKFSKALGAYTHGDRLRGGFQYFGAHTGRWAGRGVQPHNLPRASFTHEDPDTGKEAFDETGQQAALLDLVHLGLGASAQNLKKLVRAFFLGPLTVVDYAAIEARVIAWWCDEQWALQAFRDGRDIYVETAERMGGLTRAQGKVAVLALGYNGGVNSLRVMGAKGTDAELRYLRDQWRAANPAIVAAWELLNRAFRHGGQVGPYITVIKDGHDRWIQLPSGRALGYHRVGFRSEETQFGPRMRASFANPARPGLRQDTYGGKLAENITQAIARDILVEGLIRLEERGYRTVGHVHDEVIVEGLDVVGVKRLACQQPTWAKGLPIDGEGFTTDRYRKG